MTLKFKWQDAIFNSDLPSTTKLVLLAIGRRMKADGTDAYPSTKTLAKDTSLSERSVITHLNEAERLGWIVRRVRGFSGQHWKRHAYDPAFPKRTDASSELDPEGTERGAGGTERGAEGTETNDDEVLKEVQSNLPNEPSIESSRSNMSGARGKGTERRSAPPPPKSSQPTAEGARLDAEKRINQHFLDMGEDVYTKYVERIDEELYEAAITAELDEHGTGSKLIEDTFIARAAAMRTRAA